MYSHAHTTFLPVGGGRRTRSTTKETYIYTHIFLGARVRRAMRCCVKKALQKRPIYIHTHIPTNSTPQWGGQLRPPIGNGHMKETYKETCKETYKRT